MNGEPTRDRHPVRAGVAAGAIALALYAATVSRHVGSEDIAEFQTLVVTGGIAHAGYPLPVLLFHALGLVPIGSPAVRANLLCALAGAVAVGCAAWLATHLTRRAAPAIVAALALALSVSLWSESTHAEVYALTLPITAFLFVAAWRYASAPSGVTAFLAGLLGGLGLVSHLSMLGLIPVVIASAGFAARDRALRVRHVALAAAGLLVGLLPLVYMIAQDRPDRPMNYLHDTLRSDNVAELTGGHPPTTRIERAIWLLSSSQYLGGTAFTNARTRVGELALAVVYNEFPVWGVLLAVLGLVTAWRSQRRTALLLSLWLAGTLFWLLYGANSGILRMFFLPGLWALAILVGFSLAALARRSRPLFVVASLLLLVTPLVRLGLVQPPGPLAHHPQSVRMWSVAPAQWSPFRDDDQWDEYGRAVMRALPPRAVVLTCWQAGTTLRYFRYAEPLRDDVDVLYHCRLPAPGFAAADSAGRPIYTTYPLTAEMTGGRPFEEVGRWRAGGLWRIGR